MFKLKWIVVLAFTMSGCAPSAAPVPKQPPTPSLEQRIAAIDDSHGVGGNRNAEIDERRLILIRHALDNLAERHAISREQVASKVAFTVAYVRERYKKSVSVAAYLTMVDSMTEPPSTMTLDDALKEMVLMSAAGSLKRQ